MSPICTLRGAPPVPASCQSKSLGLVSWCDRESLCALWLLMHERELFGRLGGEPVMRAERVRGRCGPLHSCGGREGPFEYRFACGNVPFGRLSCWSACMTERSVKAYGVVGATRAFALEVT